MNSPLIALIAVAIALIAFELVTRRSRRNPAAYTLATTYTGGAFSTAAYYRGRHVCTAVHICSHSSRRLALASALAHLAA